MSKGCKCKPSECEECPEWIFTFADLVMLMMGFFVILWVLKPNPTKPGGADMDPKWLEAVAKIREAFKYLPDPTSKDPVDMYILMKKLEELDPLKGKGHGGETKTKPKGATGTDRETTAIRPGSQSIIGTRVRFEAGKQDLSEEGKTALRDIAHLVQGHRNIFIIKGHASADDFATSQNLEKEDAKLLAQNRMNLSVRRAQVVADYLTSVGVNPDVIRVQGCSTFEPLEREAYSENQNVKNRRVEVESSDSTVNERQDNVKTTSVLPPGLKKDFEKDKIGKDRETGTADLQTEHAIPR